MGGLGRGVDSHSRAVMGASGLVPAGVECERCKNARLARIWYHRRREVIVMIAALLSRVIEVGVDSRSALDNERACQ